MQKVLLTAALASAVVLAACGRQPSPTYTNSAGSLALSRDDSLIYAVDTDNELLAVVDAATQTKVAEVKVGRAPETVVVSPNDTIYVANRGGRSISVIHKGDWQEAQKIPVAVEPTGMAVAPDGKTLYVVNGTSLESADTGTLMAIDTASSQVRWELAVGEEPRSIALVEDGKRALVTLFKKGDVVKVDLEKGQILQDNTVLQNAGGDSGLVRFKANETRLTGGNTGFGTPSAFHPRAASSITSSPDGKTAYMTVTWAREDNIAQAPNTGGGYYAAGGPCNIGAVATPGLVSYTTEDAQPQVDDLTACGIRGQDTDKPYPSTTLTAGSSTTGNVAIQGSTVSIVDPTGAWLYIVNRESQNVAVTPTARRGGDDINFDVTGSTVRDQVNIGSGANGIAMTRDGKAAYVYNQFDHSISVLTQGKVNGKLGVVNSGTIKVADDVPSIPVEVLQGRKLFFSSLNADVNDPLKTGVSCNTCHTEGGREDGHVWGFPDGKRQTPALAGRMLGETAPYHWSGEFANLSDFMAHTTVMRMGGHGTTAAETQELAAYMAFAPAPENPNQKPQPTDAQVRGAQVFQQAGCNSCHGGQAYTLNNMADVGTLSAADKVLVSSGTFMSPGGQLTALNTPSLLGLARTAPYLHDGSALTLKARLKMTSSTGAQHGDTQDLTDAQMDDLVEFLKAL